jgi:hypothetical protein
MIPEGTSHNSVPNSTYEVSKGTMKTRFEPSLPRMSARKIINFTSWIRTQDPCSSGKFFAIGPSRTVTWVSNKVDHVKTPVEGVNLPNRQE